MYLEPSVTPAVSGHCSHGSQVSDGSQMGDKALVPFVLFFSDVCVLGLFPSFTCFQEDTARGDQFLPWSGLRRSGG